MVVYDLQELSPVITMQAGVVESKVRRREEMRSITRAEDADNECEFFTVL
jgi:hypothetical protein